MLPLCLLYELYYLIPFTEQNMLLLSVYLYYISILVNTNAIADT